MAEITIGIAFYKENQQDVERIYKALYRQENTNFKVLIIHDDSLNNNLDFNFFDKFDINILLLNENIGLHGVRNLMIANCQTEYIFYLDGDDFIPRNFIKKILESLVNNVDLFYFDYERVWLEDKKRQHVDMTILTDSCFRLDISKQLQLRLILGCSVYKVSSLKQLNGYNEFRYEDFDLHLRLYNLKNFKSIYISGIKYYWIQKPNSLNSVVDYNEYVRIVSRNYKTYRKHLSFKELLLFEKYFLKILIQQKLFILTLKHYCFSRWL